MPVRVLINPAAFPRQLFEFKALDYHASVSLTDLAMNQKNHLVYDCQDRNHYFAAPNWEDWLFLHPAIVSASSITYMTQYVVSKCYY